MVFGRANQIQHLKKADPVRANMRNKDLELVPSSEAQADTADDEFYTLKEDVRSSLVDLLDAKHIAELDTEEAHLEISGIILGIISAKGLSLPTHTIDRLTSSITDDVLGLGPLEPLLARDDITDIMVNGPNQVFIEVGGRIQKADVRFQDAAQLMNICQRIVGQVGRRVDESSPICEARLLDGSRVNVISPPLSIDGATLTIRKFQRDKLTLDDLVRFGSISPEGAEVLQIVGRVRCNVLISGGTGSGKTTLLNCLAAYNDSDQRIVTCEDAAEHFFSHIEQIIR